MYKTKTKPEEIENDVLATMIKHFGRVEGIIFPKGEFKHKFQI